MVGAAEIVAAIERENAKAAADARCRFDAWRVAAGLELVRPPPAYPGVSTEWIEVSGDPAVVVGTEGHLADLIVISREPGVNVNALTLEAALFASGRPVLSVPPGKYKDLFSGALIAWKPSAEAARAVSSALPMLGIAQKVEIFAVADKDLAPSSVDDFRAYLACHGIRPESVPKFVSATSVGEDLLETARRCRPGFIVLGAYSHSRLREFILGGVTQHVLTTPIHRCSWPIDRPCA
jgi:nucleotide-binding universal stress UspA family protein